MLHLNSDSFLNSQSIILEIISSIFIIVASELLIVQGFDNENYRNYGSREIKTERLLFTQFSREVYSNILDYTFTIPNSRNVLNYQYFMTAEIKLNPSFDCRGVKDEELNENICQDKIINNDWTCCRAECCSRTKGGKVHCYDYNYDLDNPTISNYKILTYDEEESFKDPRKRFCTYYNRYHKDIYLFNNQQIKISYSQYNYEDLLLNNSPSVCIGESKCEENYVDCGIIDTMNRHLYASNPEICPVNNIITEENNFKLESFYNENIINDKKIILRNIISEISPIAHEYKNYFECPHEDLRNEEITIKDMNNLLKNSKNIYTKIENISIPINSIGNNIRINSKSNNNSKLYWYTTNYIGFKSMDDLIKFKKYFNSSDHKDNPLYKIGEDIYPYFIPIIIMFFLSFIFLLYIIYLIYAFFHKNASTAKKLKIIFIIRIIIGICMLVIESIFYGRVTNEFKKIKIEMDENYKEILDLYNKRRLQIKYLLSIIFLVLSFIPLIIFFVINCKLGKLNNENIEIDNNHVNNNVENPVEDNHNNNDNNDNNNNNNNRMNIFPIESSRNNFLSLNSNINQNNNNNNNNKINNNMDNNMNNINNNINNSLNNNINFTFNNNMNNIINYNINNNLINDNNNIIQNINNSNLINNKFSINSINNNINNELNNNMYTINYNKNDINIKEVDKDSKKEININKVNSFNIINNDDNENDINKEEEDLEFNDKNINLYSKNKDKNTTLKNNRIPNKSSMRNNKTTSILHKDNNIFDEENNKGDKDIMRLLSEPKKDNKTTIDITDNMQNNIKSSDSKNLISESSEEKNLKLFNEKKK